MFSLRAPTVLLGLGVLISACGNMPNRTDGGGADASVSRGDAGPTDGGRDGGADGGAHVTDGGADGGRGDAGSLDGGGASDGGQLDGGCPSDGRLPLNVVRNSGFECGTQSWMTVTGQFDTVPDAGRTGRFAGRLRSPTAAVAQVISDPPIVASASGKRYCARAHMRGDAAETEFGIFSTPSNQQRAFFAPAISDAWLASPRQDTLSFDPFVGEQIYVRFFLKPANAGETLFVDDIEVWESPSGSCNER